MSFTQKPGSWSADQFAALNALDDIYRSYDLLNKLVTLTGNQGNPIAVQLLADLKALANQQIAILATYPA